jgi:hypothetical protein
MAAIVPARVALLSYSPAVNITGSGAVTLAAFTGSGSGALTVTGSGSVTLSGFTGAGSGTLTITGSGAVTLAAFTGSGSATLFDGTTPGYVTVAYGGPTVTVTFSTDDGSIVRDYDIGDRPVITATFKDNDAVLTTPSTVVVKLMDPSGNVDTYTTGDASLVTASTGVIEFTVPSVLDETGPWSIRFKGTAGLQAAYEGKFRVRRTSFPTP